jgi:hypothetical protein
MTSIDNIPVSSSDDKPFDIKDPTTCLNLAAAAIKKHPTLNSLVTLKHYKKWKEILLNNGTAYTFTQSPFNFLTASVVSGVGLLLNLDDPGTMKAHRILSLFNQYLELFPQLKNDKSFKGKLHNLEGPNFLATLNELALAHFYQTQDYLVTFEKKFTRASDGGNRDVDITIVTPTGTTAHLEVYMPIENTSFDGFFDFSETNKTFSRKIELKNFDKFGLDGIDGLSHPVILAINTLFWPLQKLQAIFQPKELKETWESIAIRIPKGVHGILFYHDDFSTDKSLKILEVYLTQSTSSPGK